MGVLCLLPCFWWNIYALQRVLQDIYDAHSSNSSRLFDRWQSFARSGHKCSARFLYTMRLMSTALLMIH